MSLHAISPAKLQQTFIDDSVRMRETSIGQQCEVLAHSYLEYSTLGDFSYVGEHCNIADTQIGRFTAIANQVRIGAPNHPMDRASQHRFPYCPEYYGVPAKPNRARFTPAIAASLQRIAWWNWPLEKLMANLADFQSADIERFCARHG